MKGHCPDGTGLQAAHLGCGAGGRVGGAVSATGSCSWAHRLHMHLGQQLFEPRQIIPRLAGDTGGVSSVCQVVEELAGAQVSGRTLVGRADHSQFTLAILTHTYI